jgi:hypothetical protein
MEQGKLDVSRRSIVPKAVREEELRQLYELKTVSNHLS